MDDLFEIVYNAAVAVTGDQVTANEIAKRALADAGRRGRFDNEQDAAEAMDNGRNTGGKSYLRMVPLGWWGL